MSLNVPRSDFLLLPQVHQLDLKKSNLPFLLQLQHPDDQFSNLPSLFQVTELPHTPSTGTWKWICSIAGYNQGSEEANSSLPPHQGPALRICLSSCRSFLFSYQLLMVHIILHLVFQTYRSPQQQEQQWYSTLIVSPHIKADKGSRGNNKPKQPSSIHLCFLSPPRLQQDSFSTHLSTSQLAETCAGRSGYSVSQIPGEGSTQQIILSQDFLIWYCFKTEWLNPLLQRSHCSAADLLSCRVPSSGPILSAGISFIMCWEREGYF